MVNVAGLIRMAPRRGREPHRWCGESGEAGCAALSRSTPTLAANRISGVVSLPPYRCGSDWARLSMGK